MATINELKAAVDALLVETSNRGIMFKGTIDPSVTGLAATQGSRYSRRDVNNNEIAIFKKTGPGNTDWVLSDVGGGGGDAISGTWNVTPTYNPSSTIQPNYIDTANANVVGDTITSDLVALPNEPSAKYKVGGTFLDVTIDLLNDVAHSRRIRLTMTGPLTDNDTHRLVFGLFQTTVTDVQTVEDIFNDRVTTTNALAFRHIFMDMSKEADGDTTVRHYSKLAAVGSNYTLDTDKDAFTAGVNTIDIYISLVDISSLTANPPPDYSILTTVVVNDTPTASFVGGDPEDLITGILFRPFIGYAAYDDTTGVTADVSFDVDFTGAPTTVNESHFGYAYPQAVVDLLMGAPVPEFGVIVPASFTQVSSLPGGAAVNKLYLATVDPGFLETYSESNVLPFGTFVRNGETIRIVNATNPDEEIDVLNIWRDVDAGGIAEVTNNQVGFEDYVIDHTDNGGVTQVSLPSNLGNNHWRLKPTIHSAQTNYETEANLNWSFNPSDRPYRIEFGWEAKNNTANTVIAANNTILASYSNSDTYACNPSAPNPNEIYIALNNMTLDIGWGFTPPYTQTKIFNEALGHDSRVRGLYYKVYLDAAITPVAGDNVTIPNLISGTLSYYIAYKDAINNIMYLYASNPAGFSDGQPQSGSWNTGSETVNITDVRGVLVLDKPVLSTIDSSNGDTTLYVSNSNNVFAAITSNEVPVIEPKAHITTASLQAYKDQIDAIIDKGYIVVLSPTLTHTSPWPFASNGHMPYQIDYFQLVLYIIEDQSVTEVAFYTLYPYFIDGFNVKDGTKVSMDLLPDDIVIKYINANDVEVSISVLADVVTGGVGNSVYFASNISVPNPINTPVTVPGSGIQNTDSNVLVAWYPDDQHKGVFGHNAVSPIFYTRGTDYTVTGTNQITFDDLVVTSFPAGGSLQVVREKDGTGLVAGLSLISLTPLEYIQALSNNPCIATIKYGSVEVLANLGTYDRPNPETIGSFSVPITATTPAPGYLFFVDEEYDPTANQEMVYQIKNALARVAKTGTFAGKSFVKNNYAMWNGVETVPFPTIPTAPTVYEHPVTVGLNLPAGVLTKIPNFTSFREALRYIVNNGKVGTILVNGSVNVYPSRFFNEIDNTVKVTISGINEGGTDHLVFHYGNLANFQNRNHYFENWKPYLDNIKISSYSLGPGDYSVFLFNGSVSGGVWDIGSNVTIDRNYNYVLSGIFATIRLTSTTFKIRFVKNLKLFKDISSLQLYCIYLDTASTEYLTLEGENLITTGSTDHVINCDATGREVYVLEHSPTVFNPKMIGGASYSYTSVRAMRRYLPLSLGGVSDNQVVINAHHPVDATGGALTYYLPVTQLQVGDEAWFTDYIGSVGAINTLTIDPQTNTINGVNAPVVFNAANLHLKFYWTGSDWKYKSF